MSLPVTLQNSHRNGGRPFLIFVADPRNRADVQNSTPTDGCRVYRYPPLSIPVVVRLARRLYQRRFDAPRRV